MQFASWWLSSRFSVIFRERITFSLSVWITLPSFSGAEQAVTSFGAPSTSTIQMRQEPSGFSSFM